MYCQKCGTKHAEGANFCPSCGVRINLAELNLASNDAFSNLLSVEKNGLNYTGFWLRFAAYALDFVFIGVPLYILAVIVSLYIYDNTLITDEEFTNYFKLVSIIVVWGYFAIFESSSHQATLGKRIIGLKVTDQKGEKISFGRASGRHFAKIISSILFIGFIVAGFTKKKQALHDLIVSTLVVKK
ncbi:RDD family protein [Gottfriedia acidiceleris]|uniref:RDD family protein n=1 Tax=Gottfriedia acidiceleris TaxID=371036 RepID=UPI002FFEA925